MPNGRKPGRPRDPYLEHARNMFPSTSPRTQARYARALKMATAANIPSEVLERLTVECSTSYGGFNFAAFERRVEDVAAVTVATAT